MYEYRLADGQLAASGVAQVWQQYCCGLNCWLELDFTLSFSMVSWIGYDLAMLLEQLPSL